MSLNTAHASGHGVDGVLIYTGERILIFYDGVEMGFDMSCSMPHFKGNKKGRAYLTTHRVIFNTKDRKDSLQSFSMPFHSMQEVELEQPVFGANYIKGKVKAEQSGNWDGTSKWKMWFTHGGAIEFGKAMLDAGRMASRYFTPQPPVYSAPTGPYYQPPPSAYAMPQAPMYSFVPTGTFPTAPPYDGVYMSPAPPPYPGIDPNINQAAYPPQQQGAPYPPQQGAPYPPQQSAPYPQGQAPYPQAQPPYPQANGHDAKAAEAAASGTAYYNPENPHNVYMPTAPPEYGEMPPSYSEATKKSQ